MKRNLFLQPLSREHHTALTLAKSCVRAAQSRDSEQIIKVCLRAVHAFSDELEPHFQIEEQSLLPLLQDAAAQMLVQRTLADHRNLRDLKDGLRKNDSAALESFGRLLSEHVRFEERELFEALESVLPQ